MSAPAPGKRTIDSPWLTPQEAMEYLGLPSLAALYQATRRGHVPAHRLSSRTLRYYRPELDAVLLKRKTLHPDLEVA